ncbi:MAG: NAD-binding protein, partial [Deinococcus sp.]|nr:NAD-binding protein [Deinococcus sp.]
MIQTSAQYHARRDARRQQRGDPDMKSKQCLVVGLGRFGSAVATTLYEMGHEVVAIDHVEENVERIMNRVTHAAILDATDERGMRAIGVGDFDVVVVAIGSDVQA